MLKYEALAADIQKSIEDGTLKPNEKLPTVVELCEMYAVSKITVRRAMEWLAENGLVASRRGSGTYVKQRVDLPENPLVTGVNERAQGFSAEHSKRAESVSSEVYDFDIVKPPAEIANLLNMDEDDFAYYDCRVRLLNDVPIVIEYTYMPIDLIPGLKRKHLYTSIYAYIHEELGLKIASFHRAIRAVAATTQEAERLDVNEGEPLLELEQVGFLDTGTPFEYSISRNVGSRYTLNNITLA